MPDAPTEETLEQRKARIAALRRMNAVLPKEQRHPIPPLHDPGAPAQDRPSTAAVETLLAMPRRAYQDLVCSNLAADKDDMWALYLDPRVIQFTHAALIRKRAALARLTRDTRESAASKIGRRRWSFIEMLESRIQQTESCLPDNVLTSDRNTARHLFAAIQAHRRALIAHRVHPEPWDVELWQAIDNLTARAPQQNGPGEPPPPTPVL